MRWRALVGLVALSTALGVLAVLHDGTKTADLDLNDGGVWVTYLHLDGGRSVAAHLNYPSRTLDSYTEPAASTFDVMQEANGVVIHNGGDGGPGGVAAVDTTTWVTGSAGSLPQGAQVAQGTDTVVVADATAGKVWAVPVEAAGTFSADAKPILDELPGVRATIGRDDTIHTVTPDGTLRDLRRSGDTWETSTVGSTPRMGETDQPEITAVGATGVVLDRVEGWVAWPEHHVALDDAAGLVLQQPGDPAEAVVLAGPASLVTVPLEGDDRADVRDVASGGQPIAPVTVGSCTYAAWTGSGQYVRDCVGTADDVEKTYDVLVRPGATPGQVVFRVNRAIVVLNDTANGDVLLPDEDMEVVNDWAGIRAEMDTDDQQKDEAVTEAEFRRPKDNRPPLARPDVFGVRAGQSVSLPVLGNDTDPDGDVLLASVADRATTLGGVDPVRDGRGLRIAVDDDATGSAGFTYEASDGRPEGRASGQVQLQVHGPDVNAGPQQLEGRTSALTMVERGTAEHHVLQEWFDPDGDPFWVSDVRFPAGTSGVFRPDGLIKVTDDGTQPAGQRTIEVDLTDGRDSRGTTTAQLVVTVQPRDAQLAPTANADFVRAVRGEPVEVRPLRNDVDPRGRELYLTSVGDVDGGQVSGDVAEGSYTFTGSVAGTFYADYSISNGPSQATGVIRIDVADEAVGQAPPVPDSDIAVLPASGEGVVDVLANDTDPLGGVLVLQSVSQADGVTASVVGHSVVKLENTGLGDQPVTLSYSVANAAGAAAGTVTVIADRSSTDQTPVAYPDTATVRAGDVVTVDVTANDAAPGDLPLTVSDDLQLTGPELGTAFVGDGKVRFKADDAAGSTSLTYTVLDADQNASSATLDLNVVPLSGSNAAPAPRPTTARVTQGGTTEIQVPVDGIDADGDSVTLLGLATSPAKGSASVDGNVITYVSTTAANGTGTDSFSYLVQDRFGAEAEGRVEVGIAARGASDAPPVAQQDRVVARPGRLLSVPVLANDIDPEGEQLSLDGDVTAADDSTTVAAENRDGRVQLTTGEPGTSRYTYTVSDPSRSRSQGDLVVKVAPDAPLLPPAARDDVVPLSDVVGKTVVEVPVLENDEDPDGAASVLTPSTEVDGVTVSDAGRLEIPLAPERQVIVYAVTDEDGQVGRAVVTVPGTESDAAQRPVVRADAPLPIKVKAGEEVRLPLAEYVAVRAGRTPSAPYTEEVLVGPGWDGSTKPRAEGDPGTLVFRSTPEFYGPTAITFRASDQTGDDDAAARDAILSLPVEVESTGAAPPTLSIPTIAVAKDDDAWTRDLRDLAQDPDPDTTFAFALGDDVPSDLEVSLDGSTLSVAAAQGARVGTSRQFTVTVSDGRTTVPAKATVEVTDTTRPLMSVRAGSFDDVDAGSPVEVDVSAFVTNPYADEGRPIQLVGTPRVSGGKAAVATNGGTVFTVTPDADFHGTLRATYVVADASGAANRRKQGQVTISVRGRPDAPTSLVAEATASHTVAVSWRSGANNGSPITAHTVRWTSPDGGGSGEQQVGNVGKATIQSLTNDKKYVFTVVATNDVGESDPSKASRAARPDEIPPAPAGLALDWADQTLFASWSMPGYEGSPVKYFEVSANGQTVRTAGPVTKATLNGLVNGTAYQVRVRAVNSAETTSSDGVDGAGPWSAVVTEHPNGVPAAPTGIAVVGDPPDSDPSAQVSWDAVTGAAANGEAVVRYEVRKNGGAVVCTVTETSCRVSLAEGEDARFQVRAFNRANPGRGIDGSSAWSDQTAAVRGAGAPGAVGTLRAAATGDSGRAKVTFTDADKHGAESVVYRYQIQGGGSGTITSGEVLGGFTDGADRTIEVWAITTANGKESQPGPRAGAAGNSFAPCTVTARSVRENYDTVTFEWSATSNGRRCAISYTGGNGEAPVNESRSGQQNVGTGPNQSPGFTVTARTQTGGDDAGVADRSASASGSTASPRFTVRTQGARPAGGDYVEIQAIGLNEARSVRCDAQGSPGVVSWYTTFATGPDGNSGWVNQGPPGRLYDSGNDRYARDTRPFGTDNSGLTCRLN